MTLEVFKIAKYLQRNCDFMAIKKRQKSKSKIKEISKNEEALGS